jgi:hypothetical protein
MFGKWRTKRPSHTTVVSYLALFVALGGTSAYAANTIGSGDVRDGSLLSRDIKNGQVKKADIGRNQVTTSKIKARTVRTADIAENTITTGKILDGGIVAGDLADGAVSSAKVSDESLTSADLATGAVTGAKVADDTLTAADIAGADLNGGAISLPAGFVANGRCRQVGANVPGAKAGEAVVFSVQAPLQDGIVLYGEHVPVDGTVTFDVCNFSGVVETAISNLPVRVITFG